MEILDRLTICVHSAAYFDVKISRFSWMQQTISTHPEAESRRVSSSQWGGARDARKRPTWRKQGDTCFLAPSSFRSPPLSSWCVQGIHDVGRGMRCEEAFVSMMKSFPCVCLFFFLSLFLKITNSGRKKTFQAPWWDVSEVCGHVWLSFLWENEGKLK